jgi:hypothetical protein
LNGVLMIASRRSSARKKKEEGEEADRDERLGQAAEVGEHDQDQDQADDAEDHHAGRRDELLALQVVDAKQRPP